MGQLCKAPKPFGGEDPLRLSSCADAARCDPARGRLKSGQLEWGPLSFSVTGVLRVCFLELLSP